MRLLVVLQLELGLELQTSDLLPLCSLPADSVVQLPSSFHHIWTAAKLIATGSQTECYGVSSAEGIKLIRPVQVRANLAGMAGRA